jgi:Tfp pilus assembly protein PilV
MNHFVLWCFKIRKICLSPRGSFLIEALLSVVILSTSLAVIIQSLASTAKNRVEASRYTTAVVLADNYLTDQLLKRFVQEEMRQEGRFEAPHQQYRYTLDTQSSVFFMDGIAQVNLTVSWPVKNKEKKIRASTILFDTVPTQ